MTQILGWIATTLFTMCYVPQIFKTIRTGTLDGVSVPLFVISFIANIDALAYATLLGQRPLQVKYSAALLIIGVLLIVFFVWGRRAKSRRKQSLASSEVSSQAKPRLKRSIASSEAASQAKSRLKQSLASSEVSPQAKFRL